MSLRPTEAEITTLRLAFEECLVGAPWLSSTIPEEDWQSFACHLNSRALNDGQVLTAVGDRSIIGGFVLSGIVRTFYLSPDGVEHNRYFAGPGNFFAPLVAGLTNGPSEVTLAAIGTAKVIAVDLFVFLNMYDKSQAFDRIGRRITERFYLVRERQAQQLLTLGAAERWQAFTQDYAKLVDAIPLKHAASYLGIRPETLTRIRKQIS